MSKKRTPPRPKSKPDLRHLKGGKVELWFRGKCLLRVPARARNLVKILASFQELGWPERIDDPLDPTRTRDRSWRLRDTVRRLNAHLKNSPLSFKADGAGLGVLWMVT